MVTGTQGGKSQDKVILKAYTGQLSKSKTTITPKLGSYLRETEKVEEMKIRNPFFCVFLS